MMRRLSRDPDTLRIPAFMRKRSLPSLKRQPLIWTALDRKQAGVEIAKPKTINKLKPKKIKLPLGRAAERLLSTAPNGRNLFKKALRKKPTAKKISAPKAKAFTAPLLFSKPTVPKKASAPKKSKPLGTVTHYYDKIKVGVIALNSTLEVGDCIEYKTDDGPYEQIVESMEIDRQPVFKATKGNEVGLKLRKSPRVGSTVIKV